MRTPGEGREGGERDGRFCKQADHQGVGEPGTQPIFLSICYMPSTRLVLMIEWKTNKTSDHIILLKSLSMFVD